MALLAGDIIDQARSRHAAFDERRIPSKAALVFLSAFAKQLHGKITEINPDVLRTDDALVVDPATFDYDAGAALPANRYVPTDGVVAVDANGNEYDVVLIPAAERLAINSPLAAAWIIGTQFYLRGPATIWRYMTSVRVAIVATPVPLVDKSSAVPVPDEAELCLVEAVALFMARRGHTDPKLPPITLRDFAAFAQAAETDYLNDVRNRLAGVVSRTRDVWRP